MTPDVAETTLAMFIDSVMGQARVQATKISAIDGARCG